METLFKFVLERPASKLEDDLIIDLNQDTDYQAALAESINSNKPREVLKSASENMVKSDVYVKQLKELSIFEKLITFRAKLDLLEQDERISEDKIKNAIKNSFGVAMAEVIRDPEFLNALARLKDSVIAIKHLSDEHNNPLEELTNGLRDLEIVLKVAADKSFPGSGKNLRRYRRRILKLPTQAELKSILTKREEERKRQEEEVKKRLEEQKKLIQEKTTLYQNLKKAIGEIMELDHDLLESSTQAPSQGFIPPKDVRPLVVFQEDIQRLNTLGGLQILNARTQIEKGQNAKITIEEKLNPIDSNKLNAKGLNKTFFAGAGEFKPVSKLSTHFRFKIGTEELLSKETQQTLKKRQLSITEMGIDKVVASLRLEMEELFDELEELTKTQTTKAIKKIGNTMVVTNIPKVSLWGHLAVTGSFKFTDFDFLDNRIPKTKGSVSPSGIADLIIVKQHLIGYEGRDIAHIENVLKSELKVRDHRRLRQTIEENILEQETTSVEERTLESTDRFELSRETSKTIKEEASLKAGLSVSGSYGPTVKFSASVEGSLSRTKEEATKTASKFSKEVTQKSVEKLTERILQSSKLKITNEVEEKNNHTLNNVEGEGNISGVYQWVEKVYEAQMYNYGIRMMFDFMIPEPGAYIVEAMQKAQASVFEIEKPIPFTLKPNQVNEGNYNYWIHQYGATGINPPPEEYITKALNHNAGGGDAKTDYQHSGIIQIDEGYRAVQSSLGVVRNIWSDNRVIDVVVGRRTHRFVGGDWLWITSLNNETDSIPFGLTTNEVSDIAIALEIKCQRTSRAYKKWQLDTHAKLTDAYQAKLADYEEKLAAIQLQAGIEIEGKNPALNLEVMKDELKKNCISILTDQHFDLFNAIQTGTNGLPQINLIENEAEGPYVRFFEQAFEWEHITWLTYPYFWGRKSKWEERIAFDDPDPLFNQFIKAGYCRAVVPVRPGFEGAVDHFLTFGEVWNGGPLPTISNPLYLPIADEIAERLDRPGDEVPQGEPWEVRVPTNLVKLRPDDKLPKWEKNEDGKWVEI